MLDSWVLGWFWQVPRLAVLFSLVLIVCLVSSVVLWIRQVRYLENLERSSAKFLESYNRMDYSPAEVVSDPVAEIFRSCVELWSDLLNIPADVAVQRIKAESEIRRYKWLGTVEGARSTLQMMSVVSAGCGLLGAILSSMEVMYGASEGVVDLVSLVFSLIPCAIGVMNFIFNALMIYHLQRLLAWWGRRTERFTEQLANDLMKSKE